MAIPLNDIEPARYPLAALPTPITRINWQWGDIQLFLKRDDLTGNGLSGNKIRKLEYIIADAKQRNCDTLVTCGGVQSNHARATAVAATQVGMKSTIVLTGDQPDELDGNLLLDHMVGADVRILPHMSSDERLSEMNRIAEELREKGQNPCVMPSGGSNEIGAWGYIRAMYEIQEQLQAEDRGIGCLVHACGSGGTFAGSAIGRCLSGLKPVHVAAIIEGTIPEWTDTLNDYIHRTVTQFTLEDSYEAEEIRLLDGAGIGYALNTDEEMEFIVRFARQTGIFLDPVYTGKAMFALDRDIRAGTFKPDGNILFIHTGGIYGLFPKKQQLTKAIEAVN